MLFRSFSFTKPYSEKTAQLIDEEVKVLIDGQYVRAIEMLKKNKKGHEKLANLLLDREVIFSEDLEAIFGKRQWDKKHVINENENAADEKRVKEKSNPAENTEVIIPDIKPSVA